MEAVAFRPQIRHTQSHIYAHSPHMHTSTHPQVSTHIYLHPYKLTHACTHPLTCVHAPHACRLAHVCTPARSSTHTQSTCLHICTCACTHSYSCTLMHIYSCHIYRDTPMYTLQCVCLYIPCTHAITKTHLCTRVLVLHMHIHTHTHSCSVHTSPPLRTLTPGSKS